MEKIMIVVVGGEKGGTGKTTIAVNLAAMRMRDKGDTIIIDAEPTQQNTSLWCLSREDSGIQPRITSMSKLGKTLRNDLLRLGEKFSTVIVDTGGQDSTELRASLLAADVIISPMRPSQFDIWTLDRMNKLVGEVRQVNESVRAYILLNAAHTNPLVDEVKEATQYFNDGGYENIKLLPFILYDRRVYRKVVGGYSVHDTGTDGKAEAELNQLYKEVFNV
jgi:chromosome partitioning protein